MPRNFHILLIIFSIIFTAVATTDGDNSTDLLGSIQKQEQETTIEGEVLKNQTVGVTFTSNGDPKSEIVQKFKELISDFFTDKQILKGIDIAAVGMHKGKTFDEVYDDIYIRIKKRLNKDQIANLITANKGLRHEIGADNLNSIKLKVLRILSYSFQSPAEHIKKFAKKPSIAFAMMNETLNEKFVKNIKSLIIEILSKDEYNAISKYYNPKILKF